jgi:predicted phage tail protein
MPLRVTSRSVMAATLTVWRRCGRVRRSALGGRAMNSERGRGGEVVLGAFCIVLAGTALAGATLVHGWISWVVVLLGVALLGVGVGLMTMPVRRCGPRLRR